MKKPLAVAVAAITVFCTNLAFAQNESYVEKKGANGQDVTFIDTDVLSASQFGGSGAEIRVMPSPKRVMLIRPRTQFITELLKSVEAI